MEVEAPSGGGGVDSLLAMEARVAEDVAEYGEVAERFYEFDTDASGFLEEAEVIVFCQSLGLDFSVAEARQALDEMEMDHTRDGRVSLEEFVEWWSADTHTKAEGTVAGLLSAARDAGIKPSELRKMEARAKAAANAPPANAAAILTSAPADAKSRWKRAGLQTRMQLNVVAAIQDTTGQRPSDSDWKDWSYRDWPVWACGQPVQDLAWAEARAKTSIKFYWLVVLPTAVVLGLLAISTAAVADEHVTCAYHSISRITRLTEIGWLWIFCSGCLGVAVCKHKTLPTRACFPGMFLIVCLHLQSWSSSRGSCWPSTSTSSASGWTRRRRAAPWHTQPAAVGAVVAQ